MIKEVLTLVVPQGGGGGGHHPPGLILHEFFWNPFFRHFFDKNFFHPNFFWTIFFVDLRDILTKNIFDNFILTITSIDQIKLVDG